MIQFNLLPDVKLQYIRAQKRKRIVTVIATSVASLSLAVLIVLFLVVNVAQKRHLNALSADINQGVKELQGTEDLDKVLTIQNQLLKLDDLHRQKPVASRMFTYLSQVTPTEVSVAKLDVDFEQHTMRINGATDSLSTINKFVDTLKFTNISAGEEGSDQKQEGQRAFSNVVLSNFGRTDEEASYSIQLDFDPVIFDSSKKVSLVVPQTITTRSETEKPLFQKLKAEE